jgi:hypothetical protein
MPAMDRPRVLVLDDGELDRVCDVLAGMGLAPMRASRDQIVDGILMPSDLLISTGKRTLAMPQLAINGAGGAPSWICVHTQDFHPLRERLRGLGVHYLVQSTASDATLDLFFAQLLHKGSERRALQRLPIGCEVSWSWNQQAPRKAVLCDLSIQHLRLESAEPIPEEAQIQISLPSELLGHELTVAARVERSECVAPGGHERWNVVLEWDGLEANERESIEALATGRRIGTGVAPLQPRTYVDGSGIPDWDEIARSGDRRTAQRHRYHGHVDAFAADPSAGPIGALGRDLSIRGIRIDQVERLEIGDELMLAMHAGERNEPILVESRVERRHPDGSLGLAFTQLGPAAREAIEQILEALPCVAAIAGGERIVPTEITPS